MRRALPWIATLLVVALIILASTWTPSTEPIGMFEDLEPAPAPPRATPVVRPTPRTAPPPQAPNAIASVLGRHSLTCNLGEQVPDGPALGEFVDGEVRDGVLRANTSAPTGQSGVHVRRPLSAFDAAGVEVALEERTVPQLRIAWDATGCQVLPVVSVPLAGVVSMDGSPISGASVRGCGMPTSTDFDGTFQMTAWLGIPCTLIASAQGGTRVRRSPSLEIWPELPGLDDLQLELTTELSAYEQALERRDVARNALPEVLLELEQLESMDADALDEEELATLKRRLKRAKLNARRLQKRADAEFTEEDFPERLLPFGATLPAD